MVCLKLDMRLGSVSNLPFYNAKLVLLGQHQIDVFFDVRILIEKLVPDALLDRRFQLLHTGDALLFVKSEQRNRNC